jgi:hypothetical protein
MSIYDEFRGCENATIVIKTIGNAALDPVTFEPVYGSPVTIYNDSGIFYELGASEQVARNQIQKSATGQIILDPLKVTTSINETMEIYVTTNDMIDKKYRMVTEKNPLNKDEAIIIDIIED